jgi:hypothetical protein
MVTLRTILRGAVTRFLPTAALGSVAILLAFDGKNVAAIRPAGWALMAGLLLAETAGFATFVARMRYRLETSADVEGRRSVIAGALGIVGLFVGSIFAQGAGVPWALLIALISGAFAGGVTYLPWVRRAMSAQELKSWEAVDVDALTASEPENGPLAPSRRHHFEVRDGEA